MSQIQTQPPEEPPVPLPNPAQMTPTPAGRHTGAIPPKKKVLRQVDPEERLPFTEHLEELRWRIIYALITVLLVFIPSFYLSEQILSLMILPLPEKEKMIFMTPVGAFFVFMKIAFYSALVISAPMIMYQAWEFVAPGLLQVERKYTKYFVLVGTGLFTAGAAFCYLLVLPIAMKFLIGYGGDTLQYMPNVQDYISFFFTMIIMFGVSFELPMVLVFLMAMRIVNYRTLARKRGYALVGAFVAGAMITPTPDPFNQTLLALPLYLFFELSLLFGWIFLRNA